MKNLAITLIAAAVLAGCGAGNSPSSSTTQAPQAMQLARSGSAQIGDYQGIVQELYVGYYGRPAEPAGLAYWEGVLLTAGAPTTLADLNAAYGSNAAVKTAIDSFGNGAESQNLYVGGTPTSVVNAIYQNVLGRGAEPAGLQYWSSLLANKQVTQAQLTLAILSAASTETGSSDKAVEDNRLTVANDFTALVYSQNAAAAYSGANANFVLRSVIASVGATTDTAAFKATLLQVLNELVTPNGTPTLLAVSWSGSQFVAVGDGGAVETSTDGVTWTAQKPALGTVVTDTRLGGLIWQGGRFIAVGGTGGGARCSPYQACPAYAIADMDAIVTSSDGVTWTSQLGAGPPWSESTLTGVAWSGVQFVAAGHAISAQSDLQGAGVVFTSPDGVTWTLQAATVTNSSGQLAGLNGVIWTGAQFVAIGSAGAIYTSTNGVAWMQQQSGSGNALSGVSWSGWGFVAVGANGTVLTSPDGINWTPRNVGTSSLNGVVWSGTQFVAVGDGTILSSPDGATWTARGNDGATALPRLYSVTWSGTQFVAVGANAVMTSPDGVTWTARALAASAQ